MCVVRQSLLPLFVIFCIIRCVICCLQAGGTPPTAGAHGSGQEASGSRQVHSSMARPHGTAAGTRQLPSANPIHNGMLAIMVC